MVDLDEMKEAGFDIENLGHCAELAMIGLRNGKSKEANWVMNMLENLRDECEGFEAS